VADNFQERTERATPKKREEARGRGQVARSHEVGSTLVIAAGLLALNALGPWMVEGLSRFSRDVLGGIHVTRLTEGSLQTLATTVALQVAMLLLPFAAIVTVAGVGANVAQTGFLFSTTALGPNWSRLNPISGLGRVFSLRGLVEAVKAFAKVALVCGVAALSIRSEIVNLTRLMWGGLPEIYGEIWAIALAIAVKIVLVLVALAALDYAFQRWQYERDLRMSREEVKEEARQQEGDPMVKARIRSLQRERARRRMLAEVRTADVVVTNPVHFAVALRYEAGTMTAPKVVAKGMNRIAARIREIAREAGVPIVENPPLARAIHKSVKLGGVIPVAFYQAVAELLALAYRLKGRVS
jgi:flagellar biosynthetic protein FlhB